MSGAKLLIYGITSEQAALLALGTDYHALVNLLFFLTGHAIASACFSILLAYMVPGRFGVKIPKALMLIYCFIFFVPVLGAMGMFTVLIYFRYFQKMKERTEFRSVTLPPFMTEGGDLAPGMGEGGAWSRLRAANLPRSQRLKALLAVSAGGGYNSSRLLQLATSDTDDEIRLLAFKLYDQKEKIIGAAISDALHALKHVESETEKKHVYRKLAFSYWEMVFNEYNRDLSAFFTSRSQHYALLAYESDTSDHSLLILLGRIYLRLGDLEKAETFISQGLHYGAHRDRVVPYLAELAYRKRDFKSMKSIFKADLLLRYKPGIGPVAKFWLE